ncbi:MAG: Ldh family oxidoreductase [Bryobacteraceae bacterium]
MAICISHDSLLRLATEVFQATGAPASEAQVVADHLVTASLMGYDTHGVMRIPQYVDDVKKGVIVPGAAIGIEKETQTTAVVDCGWNFGQVGGIGTIDTAIGKAREWHTATVVARRCNHAGRLGTYTARAAEQGFLAIGVCNSPRHGHFVVPWGGREGRLATNPISFAVPSNSGPPIVADFSTAEASEGAIRLHRNQEKELPDGWIVNAEGRDSNNPADFYGPPRGAILPFGGKRGYRGFALSLLVEVLGGLLGGSRITATQPGNGLGFIVVDVAAFVGTGEFDDMTHELRAYIKSAAAAPGFDEVMLPGEPDYRMREERLKNGIPIDENTWGQIEEAAGSVGVRAATVSSGK